MSDFAFRQPKYDPGDDTHLIPPDDPPKFVQIAAATMPDFPETELFALDAEGVVWQYHATDFERHDGSIRPHGWYALDTVRNPAPIPPEPGYRSTAFPKSMRDA